MSGHIILLSDTSSNNILGDSRYMGPYVLATNLREAGYNVTIIDYFLHKSDNLNYIKKFIRPDTLFIGISTTFLTVIPNPDKKKSPAYREILLDSFLSKNRTNRSENLINFNSENLWFTDEHEMNNWLGRLKDILLEKNPNGMLVLGGAKTSLALENKKLKRIDFFALSKSDLSIVALADSLQSHSPIDFIQRGQFKTLNNADDLNLKNCPITLYTQEDAILPRESLPIEISRGCIFNCKFCHYDKKESSRKDLALLKDELVRNFELFGTQTYHFCDDCFNDSLRKVRETCNMILSLPFKIDWISYARVDLGVYHPDTIDLMVESGASGLFFGIESFNDQAIKRAGKKVPSELVKNFLIETYRKHSSDCLLEGSFIVGLPGESKESIMETQKWLLDNRPLDFITASRLYLHPYDENIDKVSIDFSDYSRDPEKFNFSVSDKTKWKNEHFDYLEAAAVADNLSSAWYKDGHNVLMRNVFDYPVLKSLGFTKKQIFQMSREEKSAKQYGIDVMNKFQQHLDLYWEKLENEHIKKHPLR